MVAQHEAAQADGYMACADEEGELDDAAWACDLLRLLADVSEEGPAGRRAMAAGLAARVRSATSAAASLPSLSPSRLPAPTTPSASSGSAAASSAGKVTPAKASPSLVRTLAFKTEGKDGDKLLGKVKAKLQTELAVEILDDDDDEELIEAAAAPAEAALGFTPPPVEPAGTEDL